MGFWRRRHDHVIKHSSEFFALDQMINSAEVAYGGTSNWVFASIRRNFRDEGIDLALKRPICEYWNWIHVAMKTLTGYRYYVEDQEWFEIELALTDMLKHNTDD